MQSCKKNDTSVATPQPKLKTLTMLPSGTVLTYAYDSLGRIARISTSGTSTFSSYEYKGSDSIIVYASNGTDSSRTNAYKLNGIGYVVANVMSTGTSTYTYDVNGFVNYIHTTSTLGSATDTFTVSANNFSEHRSGGSNIFNSFNTRQMYTFLSGIANTVNNDSRGMGFLGKSSVNPVATEAYHNSTTVSVPVPGTTTTDQNYNYTYEYDSNGWISKMTKTAADSSTVTSEVYTYY